MSKKEVILYARRSKDSQGASLKDQSKDLLAEAGKQEWSIIKAGRKMVHSDTVCGENDDCPGLMMALEQFPKGGMLVVTKQDRLSRDKLKFAWIEKEIIVKKKGRILSLAGEGTDDDSAQGRFLRDLFQVFGRLELEQIRERTTRALSKKRARGELTSHIPYGYKIHPEDEELRLIPRTVRPRPVRMAEIPEQQSLIKLIMGARESGATLRSIAEALNKKRFFKPDDVPWNFQAVSRVVYYQTKLKKDREKS